MIKYLHFAVYLCIITLQIDFVMNSPVHFINDYLNINHTIIENYINIGNKQSFIEYYELIKQIRGDQIYHKALRLYSFVTLF